MATPVYLVMNKTAEVFPTCVICSTPSHLRLLCSKGVRPLRSPILQEVKEVFDIDLLTVSDKDKIATWRICDGCKKKISKSAQLKAKLMSLGNKRGKSRSLLRRTLECGQQETSSETLHPEKKPKVMAGGCQERNVEESAVLNVDHNYCKGNAGKYRQEYAASNLDRQYVPLSTPKDRVEAPVEKFINNVNLPQEEVISPEVKTHLSSLLSQTSVCLTSVVDCIFNSTQLMAALQRKILLKIDSTCQSLASLTVHPGPSVLRILKDPQCLKPEDLMAKTYRELKTRLPFVHDIFNAIAGTLFSCNSDTAYVFHLAVMYSLGMHCRNKDMCAMQKFLTYISLKFDANDELLEFFNKCGVTLAAKSKTALQTSD